VRHKGVGIGRGQGHGGGFLHEIAGVRGVCALVIGSRGYCTGIGRVRKGGGMGHAATVAAHTSDYGPFSPRLLTERRA
jgi:hypothetical protein